MRKQLLLGLFVVIGIIIAGMLVVSIRHVRIKRGYVLNIYFDDVRGLSVKAWIRIAGVKVGRVEDITYESGKAKVRAWIWHGVEIYKDAKATIQSLGMLGVKYIAIQPGTPETGLIEPHGKLYGTAPPSLEEVISNITGRTNEVVDGFISTMNDIRKILRSVKTDDIVNKFHGAIDDIRSITSKLRERRTDEIIAKLEDTIANLESTSKEINELVKNKKQEFEEIVDNINTVSQNLTSTDTLVGMLIMDRNLSGNVTKTIQNLSGASSDVKKMVSRFTGVKTFWDYNLKYGTDGSTFMSDFGVSIYPKPDKFYLFSAKNIGSKDPKFNLIGGRDINRFKIYGGFIYSTLGGGCEYSWFKNFSSGFELFDFNRQYPQLDLIITCRLTKWLKLQSKLKDVLLNSRYFQISSEIKIEDEDLSYMIGLLGLRR